LRAARRLSEHEEKDTNAMKNINVVIGALVGLVIGYVVRGYVAPEKVLGTVKPAAAAAPGRREPPPGSEQIYKALVGESPVLGDRDAKVTIVEFSDFQCPYCGRVMPTLEEIRKNYGKEVRIVFKHNPLPLHPDAPYAAKAAVAAGKQGKFWEMHDKLFAANNSHAPEALRAAKVDAMAEALGLDLEQYKRDVASPEAIDLVGSDQAQARQLGANGTPAFFINGQKLTGAQPYEQFKDVIDSQLKRADEALARGVPRAQLYDVLIKDGLTQPAPSDQPSQAQPPPAPQAHEVEPGEGPARGGKHPKVVIVEWSDFQCPFCSKALPTLQQIEETYKDDVRIVWRNEPLPMHPNALPAAKAAMAAGRQGKFWQMHDLMFAHQSDLSEAKYEEWAKKLGLNVARWKRDVESPEIASAIEKDQSYGQKVGADGTPTFFINGKIIAGALPFESFKPILDEQIEKAKAALKKGVKQDKLYATLVAENVKAAGPQAAPAGGGAAGGEARVPIDPGSSPALGPKNAPVTVVVWSDFQCPFCGRVEPTLQQLREQYGNKVKFVWKNQPLPFHPNAMPAAEAAMAADEQGKFWPMHDKLFQHQAELSPQLYDQVAKELGLNLATFHASIEGHKHAAQIQEEMAAGARVGASGTPTFFINGRKLVGAQPVEAFKQIIDSELAATVAKK
jgi:protein-disulfide isomerase